MNVLSPILFFLIACVMLTPCVATAEGATREKPAVDIYLIAGQSNAVGYSFIRKQQVTDPKLLGNGYENIWYIGDSQSSWEENGVLVTHHHEISRQPVKIGFGRDERSIGAEAGMAQALSVYYNADTGRAACIIKFAHGGTNLLDVTSGENACEGNWCPPSYEATLKAQSPGELTGGMYRKMIAYFTEQIRQLASDTGCAPHVKGLFWMQGESDSYAPSVYKKAFTCFAGDVRKDLSAALDADLTAMPIYVGEISHTFAGPEASVVQVNERFIAMQNTLPDSIPNVYIIPSAGLSINPGGTDAYHWSGIDMLAIGNMVGEAILKRLTE